MSKLLKPFCEAAEPERGGISIPHRRSTDPESPTFEPTVMLALNGKAYYVHLDVWREIERLNSRLSEASPSWVAVSERKPEDLRSVLLYVRHPREKYPPTYESGWWNGMSWFTGSGMLTSEFNVTHWMLLPDGPKPPSTKEK